MTLQVLVILYKTRDRSFPVGSRTEYTEQVALTIEYIEQVTLIIEHTEQVSLTTE